MKMVSHKGIVCFLVFMKLITIHCSATSHGDSSELDGVSEEFVPTKEWQVVKPGQAIPAGLHVRLNMMTGEKEAKLLEDKEKSFQVSVVPDSENDAIDSSNMKDEVLQSHQRLTKAMEDVYKELQSSADIKKSDKEHNDLYKYWTVHDPRENAQFTREELEKALASMKEGELDNLEEGEKQKFRSMEEIKEELSKFHVDVKTDNEILKELFERYKSTDLSEEDRLVILEDFEYYVHQIDNAVDFVEMGGFDWLAKDLNHTNDEIRGYAAFVIGSAAQSNPPVQIAIIENKLLQKLIQMLSLDGSSVVRVRALYALSTTIRHIPFAQQKFVEFGGMHVLHSLFTESGSLKLQVKAMTLITDLLKEQHFANSVKHTESETQQARLHQYQLVPLEQSTRELGFCHVIPPLLAVSDHDSREKTLRCMATMSALCAPSFSSHMTTLQALEEEYVILAEDENLDEGSDGYFHSLLELVGSLKSDILKRESMDTTKKEEL